ncbi:MAG: phenylalanine--tRNA ligase subunit beta [Candidatus Obscuribacterales bacterium]|nr:phenylalanine--tRNA ligase subunit beta [Candidatus Obscuribacterales bacterium]
MIVSWNWLKEYVDLDMSDGMLAEKLMMAGLNHESTSEVEGDLAIDLEVTSNRPDCLGHLGIAREVAVLFGKELKFPKTSFEETNTPIESLTSVEVDPSAATWCPQYRARLIEGLKIGPSPAWLKRRLATLGLPSINNVVDITNYVLMECGQPLHAFDFDKLAGKKIIVRNARAGEKFLAINNHLYELRDQMGVIADAEKPSALAGIMGGKESEVSADTKTILLESAEFLPLSIRRTARAIDLSSDSSYRFERKIDPAGVTWASNRACHLLTELCGGKVAKGAIHVGAATTGPKPIRLRIEQVYRVLGMLISADETASILRSLGMTVEHTKDGHCNVNPPTFRRDITREIDLIEEVGRVKGYDAVPQDRPIPMAVAAVSREKRVMDRIRTVILGAGFQEAMTFSFTTADSVARVRPWSTREPITLLHSSRKHENKLRQSLVPSLLDALRLNESRANDEVKLFECAPIYLPSDNSLLPAEPMTIALLSTGNVREMQGVMDTLMSRLGIATTFRPADRPGWELGESAEYLLGDKPVAIVGAISSDVRSAIDLRSDAVAAEILLPPLMEAANLSISVLPLPDRPAVIRDLSVVLDESVPWAKLETLVRQQAGSLLESLQFVDLFRGKQIEAGKKSIAFRLIYRAAGRTLTREEVDGIQQSLVEAIDTQLGGKLRA